MCERVIASNLNEVEGFNEIVKLVRLCSVCIKVNDQEKERMVP